MAAIDLNNFIWSLAQYMAVRCAAQTPAVTLQLLNTPRSLWVHEAVESDSTAGSPNTDDPYSILRITGGPPTAKDPQPRATMQMMTTGTSRAAAIQRAQCLYESLLYLPTDPLPLQPINGLTIPGYLMGTNTAAGNWRIIAFDPIQRPGYIGVDSRNRPLVSFNFQVGFVPLS